MGCASSQPDKDVSAEASVDVARGGDQLNHKSSKNSRITSLHNPNGRAFSESKGHSKYGSHRRPHSGTPQDDPALPVNGSISSSSSPGSHPVGDNYQAADISSDAGGPHAPRMFSHKDIRRATNDFSEKLGEGGFGVVYHGRLALQPGQAPVDVAVKVLRREGEQGLKEWQAEVLFLGSLAHPNLVRLYGYCCHKSDWMLVYEFISNGSFDFHLFPSNGCPVLGFKERLRVALGAAQGLDFLHKGERVPIIYRDLKTSNILVDEEFNAKLSDFGLAREGPQGSRSHISTDIVGTSGYLAPEYATRGHVSERCDVFSFGVVLLEVITGRSADSEPEINDEFMVQWAARIAGESRDGWQQLVDPRLEGRYEPHAVKSTLKAAFMCIQQDAKARPTMENVIDTLKVALTRTEERQKEQQ